MSVAQISSLLDYLEGQPELANSLFTRTKEGRGLAKKMWEECAHILNNVAPDCPQKTADQWRLFYNEYKHKVMKKLKIAKNEIISQGGEGFPSGKLPLTPLQTRLYNMLKTEEGGPATEEGNQSSFFNENDIKPISLKRIRIENSDPVSTGSTTTVTIQPDVDRVFVSSGPQTDFLIEKESSNEADTEPKSPDQPPQSASPRRRRRRRQAPTDTSEDFIERAIASMAASEQVNTEATLKMAAATNRLAAAIETISDRLLDSIKILVTHRKRRRNGGDSSEDESEIL